MSYLKDVEHFTLLERTGLGFYFPDIMRVDDTYIMSFRMSPERRYAKHIDPASFPALISSKDPTSFDLDKMHIVTSLPGGGQLPCLSKLADGSIVMTDLRWHVAPGIVGQSDIDFLDLGWPARYGGSHIIPIELRPDGSFGHGAARKINIDPFPEIGVSGNMVHLGGDEYLLCADVDHSCYDEGPRETFVLTLLTTDAGRTWDGRGIITRDAMRSDPIIFVEPCMIPMPGGRLLCSLRSLNAAGEDFIYMCESYDAGDVWSVPRKLPLLGHPQHMLLLPDGRVLMVYGKRKQKPLGIACCISEDGGRTWREEDEVMIRSDAINDDLGYPRAMLLPDGSVFVVYYLTLEYPIANRKTPKHGLCPTCNEEIVLHFCDKYYVPAVCGSRFFVK